MKVGALCGSSLTPGAPALTPIPPQIPQLILLCLTDETHPLTLLKTPPQTLKRPPYQLLEGDFVRADCCVLPPHPSINLAPASSTAGMGGGGGAAAAAGTAPVSGSSSVGSLLMNNSGAGGNGGGGGGGGSQWRVLKKDEAADFGNCVCRIMTNKRGNWQGGGGIEWLFLTSGSAGFCFKCDVMGLSP